MPFTNDDVIQRSEAELLQDQKSRTRMERALRATRDKQKDGKGRIKAVGIKRANPTLVEDEEYGVINLRQIKSLKDFQ
jgi:hypothetical protein